MAVITLPSGPASAPFRIPASAYFRTALAGPGVGGAVVGSLAGVGVAILGMIAFGVVRSDIRFVLFGLMILVIVIPMAMALAYFHIALSPEATRSTLLHTVEITPDGAILINYIPDDTEEERPPRRIPEPEAISAKKIASIKLSGERLAIRLKDNRLILIPLTALSPEQSSTLESQKALY